MTNHHNKQHTRTGTGQVASRAGKKSSAATGATSSATMPAADIEAMYARLAKANPAPKSDLEYVNAYTLLVAVVLSAQSTDAGVNKATRPLFAKVDSPAKMVALGEEQLIDAIKTIGLFRNKAKNIIALSQQLVEKHGGKVPDDRDALEALPGVGRKSANVVLNIAFGQPVIAVDTHIHRVANRTGLAPGKTPRDVEDALERVTPEPYLLNAHHWLILHGRYVCKAKKPECAGCLISNLCRYDAKTL